VNTLLKKLLMVSLAVAAGVPVVLGEPPKAAPAKPALVRSAFVMPASVRDGRDPFFPESTRPYEDAVATKRTVDVNVFSVKGISIVRGHPMAIINNHTFAIGDEGDVITSTGRVHLRCTDIRPGIVVIEVNGSKRELNIGTK
jgi:hypothetical protein